MSPKRPSGAPTPGAATRKAALGALARVEDEGAYANLALPGELRRSGLSEQDRGLVTDLVYGSIRRRRACDHLVDRFLSSDPPPAARRSLRLGAYQIAFRSDIPSYAAVAATVEATTKRFRPIVNAVLRKVATAPVEFPDDSTRLSYPDWVLERLVQDLGRDDAFEALETMNLAPKVTPREDGYVQDVASQWVADLVGAQPGELVGDLCSAPGGKATALAGTGATVVAADLQPQRVALTVANAQRLGATGVIPLLADATAPPFRGGAFDRLLLDAPCSGLGVLRRRPDARWRVDEHAPERLSSLACRMIDAAVELVRPGGVLVYSVCTLTAVETLGVDAHVADCHPALEPMQVTDAPWRPWGRGSILLPQWADTDGMALFSYRVGA